jgi:hypothetical protein
MGIIGSDRCLTPFQRLSQNILFLLKFLYKKSLNIFPFWPIFPTEDAVLSPGINAKNRPVKEKPKTAENSVIARNFC